MTGTVDGHSVPNQPTHPSHRGRCADPFLTLRSQLLLPPVMEFAGAVSAMLMTHGNFAKAFVGMLELPVEGFSLLTLIQETPQAPPSLPAPVLYAMVTFSHLLQVRRCYYYVTTMIPTCPPGYYYVTMMIPTRPGAVRHGHLLTPAAGKLHLPHVGVTIVSP